jgi:LmbE family N-acetylglucosaminyl deacetylase
MSPDIDQARLVVAHPDDEVLWFSSALPFIRELIICFLDFPPRPEWGKGRRSVLRAHPISSTQTLGLTESGSFETASWPYPKPCGSGLYIEDPVVRPRYEANYELLVRAFRKKLDGQYPVLTHNPWGEYGHEDHVQVFRALEIVSKEKGFPLWIGHYCSNRSMGLASRYHWPGRQAGITLPVNRKLARSIAGLYKAKECWSWFRDWRWPETETFSRVHGMTCCEPVNQIMTGFHFINFG